MNNTIEQEQPIQAESTMNYSSIESTVTKEDVTDASTTAVETLIAGSKANHRATTTTTGTIPTIDHIESIRTSMQELHDTGINHTYQWRKSQLLTLRRMLLDHWDEYCTALYQDLHKCSTEAIATELHMIRTELDYTIQQLHTWMRHTSVPSPVLCALAYTHVQSRPLLGPGVLILGPFNYPVSLVLHPAIGALAAGNPVVIKPSECTPNVANLLSNLISQYFTPDVMVCITGGIPETTQLLSYHWGRIFFTGSTKVGVIVSQAAAKTMTPVTLECGGKSICYIDSDTTPYPNDPKLLQQITQRIMWSKTLNCGQTCAATDTVICDSAELVSLLVPRFIQTITTMFGPHPKTESEIGRIVTVQHTQRLIDMIIEVEEYIAALPPVTAENNDDHYYHSQCRIVLGGSRDCDASDKYIAPTIIVNPPLHLRIMQEEIFGPILPIITVSDRNSAIQYIRTMNAPTTTNGGMTMTPLCLYVFTNSDHVLQQMIQQVPSGSVVRNDCLIHLCSPYIPFGGLGTSGYGGAYHGKHTFDLFSHVLPVMYRPYVWPRRFLPIYDWNALRCHPFTPMKKYITLNIAMRLPAVPVLQVRLVSMVLVLILAIFLGIWFGLR